MKKISLSHISEMIESVKAFFSYNFPEKVELFTIDRNEINSNNLGDLFPELAKALKSVSREIFIRGYKMTSSDLEILLKNARNCKKVKLFDCEIDTSTQIHIESDEPYAIEILDLERCGKYSKWKDNLESVKNLIDAIDASSLKTSLKEIAISDCDIDIATFKDILFEKGITTIDITENTNWDQED
mmetsp:Transcript_31857/g.28208  ORF Transcript_31857/g.28208 Transcript_31857/m.28208 type:complete len:186 (+) Transcript_31857:714-1271(+)